MRMTRWLRALFARGMPLTRAACVAVACAAVFAGTGLAQTRPHDPPRLPDGLRAVPELARVTDQTGTLSAAEQQALQDKLAAFETARGSQIAIVMVPTTLPEPISDYAQRLGDAWKIGRPKIGDGLLIVVAKDDRKVWISVAQALEGAIPDLAAARVIREAIAPRFQSNDFAGGLSAGLDSIFKLIEGEGLPAPAAPRQPAGADAMNRVIPFIVGGLVFGAILRRIFGRPGAVLAGVGSGVISGLALLSVVFGAIVGVIVLILALIGGLGGVVQGGRGPLFTPGGWSGGSGGGWRSGGGGNFGGGGAGGSW
jgi:uncharacterized protein